MRRPLRVALCPFENNSNLHENVDRICERIDRCAPAGVELLVLPEAALTGYTSVPAHIQWLRTDAVELKRLRAHISKSGISLMVGASLILGRDRLNAYLHLEEEMVVYAKTHLGRREEQIYRQGKALVPFRMKGWQFGTALCIEGHFPELFLTHRLRGAQVMLVPHASPVVAGDRLSLWSRYLGARAMDNGQYVLATNLYGPGDGVTFSGGAIAYAPTGEEIARSTKDPLVITLDPVVIDRYQDQGAKQNYIARRKEALYDF